MQGLIKDKVTALDWRWGWLIAWALIAAYLVEWKWGAIHWFGLGDTDDNMRIMQVRALLDGQGWFDMRQYRLGLPGVGFDMHWSRLVDLPIAGLILIARLIVDGATAETFAVAAAPLLPLGVALYATMLAGRRLVDRHAWPLAAVLLACAQSALFMWAPLRIDHHGWQLAFLALMIAGSADRQRFRGGVTTGLATALSLVIGLEMLPYLALAGVMTVLAWVRNPDAAERLRGYGLALAGGCAFGYATFASYDNRGYICDVLSPVYLSAMLVAGGLAVGLAALPIQKRLARLGLAGVAGALLVLGFVLIWPDCLGRPERISPELERLWFQFINEARPLWKQGWHRYVPIFALALVGTAGSVAAAWANRRDERVMSWATITALSLAATGLLFWQTRASATAQLLAVPGATWLGWHAMGWMLARRSMAVRVLGSVAAFMLVSGLAVSMIVDAIPSKPQSGKRKTVNLANRRCPTLPAMAPIARLPKATILTFVDLGPRLITVTHHRALAGPYHRNGQAILDVQHSFRAATPATAHAVMKRYGATMLLLCPGLSESTLYTSQDPKGFYGQLIAGTVPDWLVPVPLPENSPFLLWKRVD